MVTISLATHFVNLRSPNILFPKKKTRFLTAIKSHHFNNEHPNCLWKLIYSLFFFAFFISPWLFPRTSNLNANKFGVGEHLSVVNNHPQMENMSLARRRSSLFTLVISYRIKMETMRKSLDEEEEKRKAM